MRVKLAESWEGFGGDRRSSPIWPNGAPERPLALPNFGWRSIKSAWGVFVPSSWTIYAGSFGWFGAQWLRTCMMTGGDFLVDRAA